MRLLITVADAFAVEGRGTIVVPDVDVGPLASYELTVELRRPDDSRETCGAKAHVPTFDPPQPGPAPKHVLLVDVPKSQVPVGTELWLVSDDL